MEFSKTKTEVIYDCPKHSLSLFNSEANVIPKCLQVRVRMLQNLRNRAMPHERRGGKGTAVPPRAGGRRGRRGALAGSTRGRPRRRWDRAEGRGLSRTAGQRPLWPRPGGATGCEATVPHVQEGDRLLRPWARPGGSGCHSENAGEETASWEPTHLGVNGPGRNAVLLTSRGQGLSEERTEECTAAWVHRGRQGR